MGLRSYLHDRFHDRRADLFIQLLEPRSGATLLDLGGGDGSLAARICARVPLTVTVADLRSDNRDACLNRGFTHFLLDQGPLPFESQAYDYVLCNSVIEHVTLPVSECRVDHRIDQPDWEARSWASQSTFAAEIRRVGRSYFVQTPHRYFPVDQHVHLPFTHFLSHNAQCRVVAFADRYWIKSCNGIVDWELLTPSTMATLFPEARISVERFAGLGKSVIAWHRSSPH
jgi:hypothetical protein